MYPDGELNRLAVHKLALRERLHLHRGECARAAVAAARPIAWLDRAALLWQRITPFAKLAAVPAALIFKRTLFPRVKLFGALLRWGPLAFKIWRSFNSANAKSSRPFRRRNAQVFR